MKALKKIATVLLFFLLLTSSFTTVNAYDARDSDNTMPYNIAIYTPSISDRAALVDNCSFVNLRNSDMQLLDVLSAGTEVKVIERYGNWFLINYKTNQGYIHYKYLDFMQPPVDDETNIIGNSVTILSKNIESDELSDACKLVDGIILEPEMEFDLMSVIPSDKMYLVSTILDAVNDTTSIEVDNTIIKNSYFFPFELSVSSNNNVIFVNICKVK